MNEIRLDLWNDVVDDLTLKSQTLHKCVAVIITVNRIPVVKYPVFSQMDAAVVQIAHVNAQFIIDEITDIYMKHPPVMRQSYMHICPLPVKRADQCRRNICQAAGLAKAAIIAGKAVLCEKPLTVTAEQAHELADLAAGTVVTGTVFNNRFLAPIMRARQLIDEGRIGRILGFEFSYKHNSCIDPDRRVGWKQTADFGGGTWYDLGPHVVDLCHYLCGDLSFVLGKSQIAYPTHLRADGSLWETNANEAFALICGTREGAMGTITVSKLTQGANDELSLAVCGERGSLSFSLMDPNYLYFYDATATGTPMGGVRGYTRIECVGRYPSPASGFPTIKAPQGWLRGHIGSMAAFLSAVAEGTPFTPSFAEGAYVQDVLEAALRSDREGREIRLC